MSRSHRLARTGWGLLRRNGVCANGQVLNSQVIGSRCFRSVERTGIGELAQETRKCILLRTLRCKGIARRECCGVDWVGGVQAEPVLVDQQRETGSCRRPDWWCR